MAFATAAATKAATSVVPAVAPTLGASLGAGLASVGSAIAGMSNPLGWATLGLGVLTSMSGTGAERAAGRRKMGYIGEQQAMLEGQGQQIGELAGMKTELATDIYGTDLSRSMFQSGQDLYGLTRQGMDLTSKIGFARSGRADLQLQRGTEAAVQQFGFQRQGLQDVLGQKLMDISEWEGAEQGRLASEQSRLKYEMEEARAQKNKKFLGIF